VRILLAERVAPTALHFEVVGGITDVEVIAVGRRIRGLRRLLRLYGHGRWRKMKGQALVRLPNGRVRLAELHWTRLMGWARRK